MLYQGQRLLMRLNIMCGEEQNTILFDAYLDFLLSPSTEI